MIICTFDKQIGFYQYKYTDTFSFSDSLVLAIQKLCTKDFIAE